jgi:nucleoid-associated protein YgaU
MTADAKIGLLLGLVFIVIIAFLINGLPNILKDDPGSEVTTNAVPGVTGNWDSGVKNHANEVIKTVGDFQKPIPMLKPEPVDSTDKMTISSGRPPAVLPIGNESIGFSSSQDGSLEIARTLRQSVRHYRVVSGDNLSRIAVKVYGSEEGDRLVNIDGIFNANTGMLKSKNDLQVGQKLIIPSLKQQFQPVMQPAGPAVSVVNRIRTAVNSIADAARPKYYTVKDGDSLWSISASKLGDGNRYDEILKLNSSTVPDEDSLAAGVKLKLPNK